MLDNRVEATAWILLAVIERRLAILLKFCNLEHYFYAESS